MEEKEISELKDKIEETSSYYIDSLRDNLSDKLDSTDLDLDSIMVESRNSSLSDLLNSFEESAIENILEGTVNGTGFHEELKEIYEESVELWEEKVNEMFENTYGLEGFCDEYGIYDIDSLIENQVEEVEEENSENNELEIENTFNEIVDNYINESIEDKLKERYDSDSDQMATFGLNLEDVIEEYREQLVDNLEGTCVDCFNVSDLTYESDNGTEYYDSFEDFKSDYESMVQEELRNVSEYRLSDIDNEEHFLVDNFLDKFDLKNAENSESEILLDKLSNSENYDVRLAVAENENTSVETLDKLSNDKDEDVRLAVAENENTSVETLDKLTKDEDEDVRNSAKESLEDKVAETVEKIDNKNISTEEVLKDLEKSTSNSKESHTESESTKMKM